MTKLAALLLATAGSASAFTAPSVGRTASSTIVFSDAVAEAPAEPEPEPTPEPVGFCMGMVGNEGPEPMPFFGTTSVDFDPAGFATRAPEWIPWFREAELKHGRMAMLGALGFVAPEFFRIPGEQFSFDAVPNVIQAHDALPDSMIQIFGWISLVEACTIPAMAGLNNPRFDRAPGDFSFDPIGLYPTDPAKQKEYQLAELKNGRLAMIALGGMVAGAAITGEHFPYVSF